MARRFMLPEPPVAPGAGPLERLRSFFLHRWPGRVLLLALAVGALEVAGVPLPGPLAALDYVLLVGFAAWGLFRVGRLVLAQLLWKIRTKLILSYLFVAVVPLVLLSLLFLLSGLLFSALVGSYVVSSEVDRQATALLAVARSVLAVPPTSPADLERRLAGTRATHPELAYALIRNGQPWAARGEVPRTLPSWWKGPSFAGLVQTGARECVRVVWTEGGDFLVLEVPVDERLFADLERRMGVRLLQVGAVVQSRPSGITIKMPERPPEAPAEPAEQEVSGVPFAATPDAIVWETGQREPVPLSFMYRPWDLVQRLSPGSLNTADILTKALAALAVVFAVAYCVALMMGLLLARSITRSVHALSRGTERLRRGDFGHTIPIHSRDQLGELADSFNMMSRGIEDLLRESAEKERLEEELRIAREIQMSLLPQASVTMPGLRLAALCLPANEVGGDYYDLLPLSESRLGVLVADVSGKGTSAALYMAELKGLVLSLSRIHHSPGRLLSEANRILSRNLDSRSFITMTYAVVDTVERKLRFARAGHNPLIHFEAGTGRTRVLSPPGMGLGMDAGDRFDAVLQEVEVPLVAGDVFLFFTDGLSEAMNVRAELFGERRLRDVVEQAESLGMDELKERILAEIRVFVGEAAQHDDMTLVVLKVA
jgi:serine phosphatase RsbU (regulator of sigma subunit)/energy-coupling factor transporter transmembrane protein EcfT